MVTFEQVKQDLRNLKHIEYSIQTFTEAQDRLTKQYELYKKNENANSEDLAKLEESIKKLNADEYIRKSIGKREMYFDAISQLDTTQKAIIIDSVVNGVTYWKVAQKMNFSEIAIKKRVNKAVRQIVEYLNNK